MISLIESEPIRLLILICSELWQWSSGQWGRRTGEYLCLHAPILRLKHTALSSTWRHRVKHTIFTLFISLTLV